MGTGCSIKPVFFFHYHNLHPKKVSSNKSRGKIKDFESYQKEEKKDTPTIEKKINSSSKETLDKLRILTSNLNYELLKKGKNIKEIITTEDTHLWANFDIIEELNIYVREVIDDNTLTGTIQPEITKECKEIFYEISQKIILCKDRMNFDLASTKIKVYKATITLVEIYHIIKFLKEEGFFEERKWWQGPHKDYLQYMKKSLFKKLDSDNNSTQKLKSDKSSDSDSSSISSQNSKNQHIFREELLKKWNTLAKESETEEINNDFSPSKTCKKFNKQKFSMDFSKRYQETTGPFIQSLLKPTKELLDDNKDLSLSQKTELNNKTFVLDINEEHRNSFLNSSKKNNNLNKKFVNSTNVEDFPLTNNKESDEKKSSEINENKELLHDFIKEASDNIAEVLDLLVSKENNLKEAEQSEKLDKERELINSSLIKIRNFQNFLKNLSNHNFSSEISQVLHLHLLDLKSMKAVIKTTFYKDIKKANQTNNARPSIENMTQSNLSFESYKSKIKESLNLTSLTNRNLDTKNKIIDIEKESKDNWIKFRSIHRKDSYVANNENTVLCFEDTYQNFESLIKRELINKDILSDSNQKVDFTQEYSKDLYDKWLEKHDQIVYKDLQDEGVKINNLKVIRNMGDQLDLLKTYLHKSIEKKT